jgi:hypothetical protein
MVHRGRSLELLAGSSFLERHSLCEVRRMPGPVTEPIHVRHRPLTLLADNANARKPLGEVEDPPPLAQHVGGHPLLDTTFREACLHRRGERYRAKVGGREDLSPMALRVTSILRPEEGTWEVVHRHADPITTAQPAESVIQD